MNKGTCKGLASAQRVKSYKNQALIVKITAKSLRQHSYQLHARAASCFLIAYHS